MDEDTITISVQSTKNALEYSQINPNDIGAIFVGSESHPYAVKPSATTIGEAIGATPASVISLILMESIFITAFAGYLGLVLGVGLLEAIGPSIETPFIRDPTADIGVAINATVVLIVSGAIAGFIPARRAAAIKPVVALRDE